MVGVLPLGLADGQGLAHHVADVVGDLISLAQAVTQAAPRLGVDPGGNRAGAGGGHKQGASLGALVLAQGHLGLAFPGLPGDDALGRAGALAYDLHQRCQPLGPAGAGPGQGLEGQNDERVAGQQGQRLTELLVDGRQAAAYIGVIEAGHVVVNQRGAMQQFDADRSGAAQGLCIVAAGGGHRQAQLRPDTGAARKHCVAHGGQQPRW